MDDDDDDDDDEDDDNGYDDLKGDADADDSNTKILMTLTMMTGVTLVMMMTTKGMMKLLNSLSVNPDAQCKYGLYFRDGKRKADYILVYHHKRPSGSRTLARRVQHSDASPAARSVKQDQPLPGKGVPVEAGPEPPMDYHEDDKRFRREEYEGNLLEAGLELEHDEDTKIHGVGFVKIHAPWNVLCREAEFLKLKMPTKKMYHINETRGLLKKINSVLQKITDPIQPRVAEHRPQATKRLSYPFSREKQHLFDLSDKDSFFDSKTRSTIVYEILKRTTCAKAKYSMGQGVGNKKDSALLNKRRKCGKYGITSLLANGVYSAAYPLHDSVPSIAQSLAPRRGRKLPQLSDGGLACAERRCGRRTVCRLRLPHRQSKRRPVLHGLQSRGNRKGVCAGPEFHPGPPTRESEALLRPEGALPRTPLRSDESTSGPVSPRAPPQGPASGSGSGSRSASSGVPRALSASRMPRFQQDFPHEFPPSLLPGAMGSLAVKHSTSILAVSQSCTGARGGGHDSKTVSTAADRPQGLRVDLWARTGLSSCPSFLGSLSWLLLGVKSPPAPGECVSHMEMCDQTYNITMCPLCDKTCSYWKMSSACATARASHLFDNPATVFFSIFMALWAATFMEHWKRKQMRLNYRWDLTGFEEEEEAVKDHPRAEYEARVLEKSLRKESKNKEKCRHIPEESTNKWKQRVKTAMAGVKLVLFHFGATPSHVTTVSRYALSPGIGVCSRNVKGSSRVVQTVDLVGCQLKDWEIELTYGCLQRKIAVTFAIVLGVIIYRISMAAALAMNSSPSVRSNIRVTVTATAVIINLVVIILLDEVYGCIARWLTKIEVPKTEKSFEDRLIFKAFLLKFVNSYTPIFYVAFFKGRFVGRPGDYVYIFRSFRMEEGRVLTAVSTALEGLGHPSWLPVGPGSSVSMVHTGDECRRPSCAQCTRGWAVSHGTQRVLVALGPRKMKKLIRSLRLKQRSLLDREEHVKKKQRYEVDYNLEPFAGLTPEYMEMIIQFGFVTLFVASFPLAPLFALLNNIIEIRLDAKKFVTELRRPVAVRAKDIVVDRKELPGRAPGPGPRAHVDVLGCPSPTQCGDLLTLLSLQAFVISFASDFIPRLVYRYMYSVNGTMHGFVNHTLSSFNVSDFQNGTAPNDPLDLGYEVQICRYKDYREPPWSEHKYDISKDFWVVLAARLAFVIVFQNLVMFMSDFVDWVIPDIPKDISQQIHKEKTLMVELFMKEEQGKQQLLDTWMEKGRQREEPANSHAARAGPDSAAFPGGAL
ncbi:anoctamin-1 [Orycteropus afer afer]|uniref:Anoctamin-1 n=1 Tax=Orycteropus afer afer TaxID=1230840 RepID=A0AC54ZCB2_ORYAF|nr:anoctamin-1 [Orycteropus afer afer]